MQIQSNNKTAQKKRTLARYVLFLVLVPDNVTTNTEIIRTITKDFHKDYGVNIESRINHIGNRKMQCAKYTVTNISHISSTADGKNYNTKNCYRDGYYVQCYINMPSESNLKQAIFNCKKYLDDHKKVLIYFMKKVKHTDYFFNNISTFPTKYYISSYYNKKSS